MRSIRTKMTALTLAAILVSFLSIGGMSVYSLKTEGDRHAAQAMNLLNDNLRKSLNEYLNSVEQSVDMVTRYVGETLDSVELMKSGVVGSWGNGTHIRSEEEWETEQQTRLDSHLREHVEKVRTVFRSVANHTNGVITYYYRTSIEISREEEGFFFSRIGGSQFEEVEPTPIQNFDPDDVSHVGWYYIPIERGRPSWIGPYFNDNIGIRIVSYVTPIYKAGAFIGIVGMDISYDTLVSQIKDIRVMDSGYVFLTDPDGVVVYHPNEVIGHSIAEVGKELETAADLLRTQESNGQDPIRYRYHDVVKQMYFNTLSNGMRLIVVAPEAEIHAVTMGLVTQIVLTAVLLLALFSVLMVVTTQSITEPLRRLTAASQRISEGDYQVDLTYNGNDEVGILTHSFQHLVEHLRIYINDLNSRAYQDALTGVKNKGAYNVSTRMINDSIRMSRPGYAPEFALVMLDCNDLKRINDQYGHEKGDIYLRNACELICRVFTHSPVFRMGGDEFTVILQKDDYQARDNLLTLFDAYADEINAQAQEPWEQVRIAKGIAAFDAKKDISVESVLQRADERMYEDKKRYKATHPGGRELSGRAGLA